MLLNYFILILKLLPFPFSFHLPSEKKIIIMINKRMKDKIFLYGKIILSWKAFAKYLWYEKKIICVQTTFPTWTKTMKVKYIFPLIFLTEWSFVLPQLNTVRLNIFCLFLIAATAFCDCFIPEVEFMQIIYHRTLNDSSSNIKSLYYTESWYKICILVPCNWKFAWFSS